MSLLCTKNTQICCDIAFFLLNIDKKQGSSTVMQVTTIRKYCHSSKFFTRGVAKVVTGDLCGVPAGAQ